MTIDLSGCSGERKAGDQFAHLRRRARRLQGAHRPARAGQRGLVPRAQGDHPRRQHHDGALSGADGGLERDRADGRRHDRQGARQRHARSRARRPSRAARRLHRVLRRASEDASGASSCRASRAAAGAAGPPRTASRRTVSVCQGDVRNASIEGIELKCPVVVESRGLRTDSGGAGQASRRARPRHARAQSGRRPLEFRSSAARAMPALGPVGRQARHARRFSAAAAGRERFPLHGRAPLSGAGRSPR